MPQLLIVCAVVIIICILSNKITSRFGIPMLFAFIILGMLFGSEGMFKIAFDDFVFAEDICTVALIYIMFYGGFGTRWRVAKSIAVKATVLFSMGPEHPWISKKVRELNLPPETLLVFLKRTEHNIVPTGDTVIKENDVLVLSASAYTGEDDIHLKEVLVDEAHEWCEKSVHELKLPKNSLIIMIRRGEQTLIPDGRTEIRAGDMIVLNTVHER